jgi:hypothetical protein
VSLWRPRRGFSRFLASLVDGLNTILLISAIVSFAAAAVPLALIRERDFVAADEDEEVAA